MQPLNHGSVTSAGEEPMMPHWSHYRAAVKYCFLVVQRQAMSF